MNEWLLYLQIYFGVGLVVCLAVVTSHVWMKRRQASALTDALKSLNPSRQRFWYRAPGQGQGVCTETGGLGEGDDVC